jgi:uncharacterized protein (TIGR00369 family)
MTDNNHDFMSTIGATSPESGDGRATLSFAADDRHLNAAGTIHGGLLATLVDVAMGAAIRSDVEGDSPVTSQLTLTYLRPGQVGQLIVTAEVRKRGDSLVICEADVAQGDKSLVHALATFALLED